MEIIKQFFNERPNLSLSSIEKEAGIGTTSFTKYIKGVRNTDKEMALGMIIKLRPIFEKYGMKQEDLIKVDTHIANATSKIKEGLDVILLGDSKKLELVHTEHIPNKLIRETIPKLIEKGFDTKYINEVKQLFEPTNFNSIVKHYVRNGKEKQLAQFLFGKDKPLKLTENDFIHLSLQQKNKVVDILQAYTKELEPLKPKQKH